MNIRLLTLSIQCRESREIINFSPQITYIHGQISAGKSSILRIIDYCFGGELERTPAISQELVSVELTALIGHYQVLFEREAESKNYIQVTWQDEMRRISSVLAPIQAQSGDKAKPIWSSDIYNLNVMRFCYLDQDHLDSSFYRLEDPFRGLKGRDAMRFFTGYYTERMNELAIELDSVTDDRLAKIEAAKQIRTFLQDFGYGLESELFMQIESINGKLSELKDRQNVFRQKHHQSTHFADELRTKLRSLNELIDREIESLADLDYRINEQETLQAELLTAKFKLAKSESATSVLAGVNFTKCPSCGTSLDSLGRHEPDDCRLCGTPLGAKTQDSMIQSDLIRRDLTSRNEDLEESITRHRNARSQQEKIVAKLRAEKSELDDRLSVELVNYDSAYLAGTREIDREIATLV